LKRWGQGGREDGEKGGTIKVDDSANGARSTGKRDHG